MKIFSKHILFILIFTLTLFLSSALCFAQSGHWEELHLEIFPQHRVSFGMSGIGDHTVILFGGSSRYVGTLGDTWLYDYNENKWIELNLENKPFKRKGHKLARLSKNKVLLFGGENNSKEICYDDTWVFDLNDTTWTQMFPEKKPEPREAYCFAQLTENMVLFFGGNELNDPHSRDTWIYDLNENTWTIAPQPYGKSPRSREHGMMAQINDGKVLLNGGWQFEYLNDTWIFDINSKIWNRLEPKNDIIAIAQGGMSNISKNKILLFGGDDEIQGWGSYNEAWIFDLNDTSWKKLNINIKPIGRYNHEIAEISNGKVLLFGGINGKEALYLDDTWLFTLETTDILEFKNNNFELFKIKYNYPVIEISFSLIKYSPLKIELVNLLGIKVSTIENSFYNKGKHEIYYNCNRLRSGIYFISFKTNNSFYIKKLWIIE